MPTSRRLRLLPILLMAVGLGHAGLVRCQDCGLPAPLNYLGNVSGSAIWEGSSGQGCSLRVRINGPAGGSSLKSAYANGSFTTPRTRMRAQFHVDATALAAMPNMLQQVTLLNLVSSASAGPVPTATVFKAVLRGSAAGPSLFLQAADPASVNGFVNSPTIALPASSFDMAVEVEIGITARFRYWIDADFSATPTGIVPPSGTVDNSAWTAIAGIALGEFQTSANFRAQQSDRNIVYSEIRLDDHLFWDRFE